MAVEVRYLLRRFDEGRRPMEEEFHKEEQMKDHRLFKVLESANVSKYKCFTQNRYNLTIRISTS